LASGIGDEKKSEEDAYKDQGYKKPCSHTLPGRRGLMLELNGLRREKTFQIILILEDDVLRIKADIFGIGVQVPFDVKGRRKKLIFVFFDGFEMALPYLREPRDLLKGDISRLPLFL
jgi:hypothetical protein